MIHKRKLNNNAIHLSSQKKFQSIMKHVYIYTHACMYTWNYTYKNSFMQTNLIYRSTAHINKKYRKKLTKITEKYLKTSIIIYECWRKWKRMKNLCILNLFLFKAKKKKDENCSSSIKSLNAIVSLWHVIHLCMPLSPRRLKPKITFLELCYKENC